MRSQYGKNAFAQLFWMINQRPRSYVEETERNNFKWFQQSLRRL